MRIFKMVMLRGLDCSYPIMVERCSNQLGSIALHGYNVGWL